MRPENTAEENRVLGTNKIFNLNRVQIPLLQVRVIRSLFVRVISLQELERPAFRNLECKANQQEQNRINARCKNRHLKAQSNFSQ